PNGAWEVIHFHGRHAMERRLERLPLMHGTMEVGSHDNLLIHVLLRHDADVGQIIIEKVRLQMRVLFHTSIITFENFSSSRCSENTTP
ncbi:glycoside hydrolase family 36 N-terminal domain-containing protein, partial [Hungatella sp. SL.1.14]|uniref:glycoside hydrolase family 36 N-terminal domain-containing protein n=1 Tax=Hungatella sp. SL.1.14 TaxID=2963703 RepID=UPI002108F9C1